MTNPTSDPLKPTPKCNVSFLSNHTTHIQWTRVLPAVASAAGPPPAGVLAVAAAGSWGRAGTSTGAGAGQGQAEYYHHTPQAGLQAIVTKMKQTYRST